MSIIFKNVSIKLLLRKLAVVILTTTVLSACNNSGTDAVGNNTPPSGQAGSAPSTTLTFSNRSTSESQGNFNPGIGVLNSTLSPTQTPTLSFDDLQILVFGPMCSGCHFGGGTSQPSVFDFTNADATYAALVNKQSSNSPSQTLVTSGNAVQSYLVSTLKGTQTTGSRMPMRAKPLSAELMQAINTWIDSGAKR